ncbi:FIG003620: Proteophosphoglycan precursor (Fragment) [hydrothermal vent metagenome]|uniref:FIG003620: Proteophosphoglycan n=1 Tax=hydrothermal vent metagenome TaxID=652676 RepID=A0A160TGH8_9ZZZZ
MLVTPVEKLDIAVEDAPFVAVEIKVEGEGRDSRLAFRLNTGDLVTAGSDHPLRFEERGDGPRPYLHVRGGLEALVARTVYYDLAAIALAGGDVPPGVWSNGAFFPLEPTE